MRASYGHTFYICIRLLFSHGALRFQKCLGPNESKREFLKPAGWLRPHVADGVAEMRGLEKGGKCLLIWDRCLAKQNATNVCLSTVGKNGIREEEEETKKCVKVEGSASPELPAPGWSSEGGRFRVGPVFCDNVWYWFGCNGPARCTCMRRAAGWRVAVSAGAREPVQAKQAGRQTDGRTYRPTTSATALSSREIGAGLDVTWGRLLSSRQREPVRSPPPKKNTSEIVCSSDPRVPRPKWRLHQRVQRARTSASVPSASAMWWFVRWRRRGRPLSRRSLLARYALPNRRRFFLLSKTLNIHALRLWPSTSPLLLRHVWRRASKFPDKLCTASLKVSNPPFSPPTPPIHHPPHPFHPHVLSRR